MRAAEARQIPEHLYMVEAGGQGEFQRNREVIRDELLEGVRECALTILHYRNGITGALPAATDEHAEDQDHMRDWWLRDTSLVNYAQLDPTLHAVLGRYDKRLSQFIMHDAISANERQTDLLGSGTWPERLDQKIEQDADGVFQLSQKPPDIHGKTNGEHCWWWDQDQPDSFGLHLAAFGAAFKTGELSMTPDRYQTVKREAGYLIRRDIPRSKHSTAWEGKPVHSPASTSTSLFIAKGLEEIDSVFLDDMFMRGEIARATGDIHRSVKRIYPVDYTVPEGHDSKTDLATEVALCLGEWSSYSLQEYLIQANKELGNGNIPGKRRFIGDPYYNGDGKKITVNGTEYRSRGGPGNEAVWFMALPYESQFYTKAALRAFRRGNDHLGNMFADRGFQKLGTALQVKKRLGYYPELHVQTDHGLQPNGNDLLWNYSEMMRAQALAVQVLDTKKYVPR